LGFAFTTANDDTVVLSKLEDHLFTWHKVQISSRYLIVDLGSNIFKNWQLCGCDILSVRNYVCPNLTGSPNCSKATDLFLFCISKFADLTTTRALNTPRVEENLII
jgi:hypothetical protein